MYSTIWEGGNPAIDRNPSNRRRTLVCESRGSLCSGRCVCVCVCVCVRDAGADAADGGYVVRSMWILWMTSSLSSHSTSASVSELSRLSTHTTVSSPKCNSEKRPLSNSVAFQTLFKWHRYCGILKIHIVRKINTGIRYEPVYRPALMLINIVNANNWNLIKRITKVFYFVLCVCVSWWLGLTLPLMYPLNPNC